MVSQRQAIRDMFRRGPSSEMRLAAQYRDNGGERLCRYERDTARVNAIACMVEYRRLGTWALLNWAIYYTRLALACSIVGNTSKTSGELHVQAA